MATVVVAPPGITSATTNEDTPVDEMVAFYRTLGLRLVGCCDLKGPSTLYLGDPDAMSVACDTMLSLDECERLARKANDQTFSILICSPDGWPRRRRL